MNDTDPPISPDQLEHLRLKLRKTIPMRGTGAHLRRRAGHSLTFRDYRDYQIGDDIRQVDWRASLRAGRPDERVIRRFEAEEQMSVLLIVDARPAMQLPVGTEKLLYALWSLRALAQVAARNGDEVVLATMFSRHDTRPVVSRGRDAIRAAAQFAEAIWTEGAEAPLASIPVCDLSVLTRRLRPASAVVLLSDLLFDDPGGAVGSFAMTAQKSWRQLLVQRLDTARAELAKARRDGQVRVNPVEGRSFDSGVFDVNDMFERDVRERIEGHVDRRLAAWKGPGLTVEAPVVWPVGETRDAMRQRFAADFPSGGLFSGIAARGGIA